MKYILLALFVALVCSCDNYIPCVKEYNSDTKALSKKDSINNNGNSSIIINIDSTVMIQLHNQYTHGIG